MVAPYMTVPAFKALVLIGHGPVFLASHPSNSSGRRWSPTGTCADKGGSKRRAGLTEVRG